MEKSIPLKTLLIHLLQFGRSIETIKKLIVTGTVAEAGLELYRENKAEVYDWRQFRTVYIAYPKEKHTNKHKKAPALTVRLIVSPLSGLSL